MKLILMFLLFISTLTAQSSELIGHCQVKLRVHKELPERKVNMLVLDLAIEFLNNSHILFFIEGSTSLDNKDYILSRYVKYTYRNEGTDFYEFQRVSTETLHFDNYPGDDFTEQFGIEVEHPKFHISKFYNGYIFANQFSPVFVCLTS